MAPARAIPVGLLAAAILFASCADPAVQPSEGANAVIERIVDGDTVVARISGRSESVRLLGIDTPETVADDRPVECYGPEASARLAALTPPGTPVLLVRDLEARDRYDRLLAYLYRSDDGLFVNQSLVADGYAEVLVIEPNVAHRHTLEAAARGARADDLGLWGAC